MIKTEKQIERDFFALLKQSKLASEIRGTLYRSEMRPNDAETEDIVVKFLAGLDEQVQSGVVIINVYVPDIYYKKDGRKVEDKERIETLEALILQFVNENDDVEYWMQTDGSPASMRVENIEQHVIYARIKFNRITE